MIEEFKEPRLKESVIRISKHFKIQVALIFKTLASRKREKERLKNVVKE